MTVVAAVSILAHQGGWDELLLIAGPIIVVVGLLALVKRRVEAAAQQAAVGDPATDSTSEAGLENG